MNVRLILKRNRKNVWTAELRQTEATLGRAHGCTVRIPSSEISRQHCRLRMENGILTVEDLESINGTFVNGRRVRDIQSVHSGDRLSLGPVTFLVEYEAATDPFQDLSALEDYPVVEEAVEPAIEDEEMVEEELVVEEEPTHRDHEPIPLVEPVDEPEPSAQRATELDETGEELSILDDPSSEIHLPGSSDDLRDFLIELDDSSEHPDLL